MSLWERSKQLAPLAWEPVTDHEQIPGLSVRYIAQDDLYQRWLKHQAAEGFAAMDEQLDYSEKML